MFIETFPKEIYSEVCQKCYWLKAPWWNNLLLRNRPEITLSAYHLQYVEMLHLLKYSVKRQKKSPFVWKCCSITFPELYIWAYWHAVENIQKSPGRGGKSYQWLPNYIYCQYSQGYLQLITERSQVSVWLSINVTDDSHWRVMPNFI